MALDKKTLNIPLSQGIQTKTDPKQIPSGKLLSLVNGVFETPQEIRKRNGFEELTSAGSKGVTIANFADSLLTLNGVRAGNSVKESISLRVQPVKGNFISPPSDISLAVDTNGLRLFSWNALATGTTISEANYRLLAEDGSISGDSSNLSISSHTVAIADPVVAGFNILAQLNRFSFIVKVFHAAGGSDTIVNTSSTQFVPFDIVQVGTGYYMFYIDASNTPAVSELDSNFVVLNTYQLTGETATILNCCYDPVNSEVFLIYYNGTNAIRTAVFYIPTLTLFTPTTSVATSNVVNLTSIYSPTYGVTGLYEKSGVTSAFNTVTGFFGSSSSIKEVGLASKPFIDPYGNTCVIVVHQSTLQSTYFLVNLTVGLTSVLTAPVVGKLAPGLAPGLLTTKTLPPVVSLGASEYLYPYLYKVDTEASGGVITSTFAMGAATFDFRNKTSKVEIANNLELSGALVSSYDGDVTVEQNFNLFPEDLVGTPQSVGGGVGPGQYAYNATYEWIDNYGQIQKSSPSPNLEVVTSTNVRVLQGDLTNLANSIQNLPANATDYLYPGMNIASLDTVPGSYVTTIVSSTEVFSSNNGLAAVTEDVTFTPQLQFTASGVAASRDIVIDSPSDRYVVGSTIATSRTVTINDARGINGFVQVRTNNGYIPSVTPNYGQLQSNGTLLLDTAATTTASNIIIKLSNRYSCNTVNGSPTITLGVGFPDTANLFVGQRVYGTGIPTGAKILTLSASPGLTFTISANATTTATNFLTFGWQVSSLLPAGSEITGANISAGTVVSSINNATNTVTLSEPIINGTFSSVNIFTTNVYANQVKVPRLYLTQKANVKIVLYRTLANETTAYKVATSVTGGGTSDPDYYFFTDILPDNQIIGNTQLYTNGGVLANVPPPSSDIMVEYKNRIVLVPSETPLNWQYSQTVIQGVPPEFSDLLFSTIEQRGGPITALAAMDDKLIFFKKRLLFYTVGDGPAPDGSNNTFATPQAITTDKGCDNQSSIVLIPKGLMFQSEGGIYLLDRSLSVSYLGYPAALYNNATITSAQLMPNTTRVVFTLNTGIALTYDYFVDEWGTFSNVDAVDSVIYNDHLTYLQADGIVQQETPGVYNDNGAVIPLSLQTGWFSLSGIQGFERFYELLILGEYKSPHTMNISFAYNFDDTITQSTDVAVTTSIIPYQYRVFPQIQKCQSFQLTLTETQASPGEGLSLSGLAMVAGMKRGLNKITAANSYG